MEFLKRAQTIDDVLKVQARISETRREIERIKGRMVYLERTTDMASITVSFFARIQPKADPKEGLPAWWAKTTDAFDQSLVFLGNVATFLGMALAFFWWLIILVAVGISVQRKIGFRRAPPPAPDRKGD